MSNFPTRRNDLGYERASVVIPTYNRGKKLERLIESILQGTYPTENLEIIVVDDASTDPYYEVLRSKYPNIRFLRHERESFPAQSLNDGINASSSELILVCDDDNVLNKDTLEVLIDVIRNDERVGVAGPVTFYLNQPDTIQYAGAIYGRFTRITRFLFSGAKGNDYLTHEVFEVDGIANCFMIRKSAALLAHLIPSRRIPWNGEDGYLQYKVKKLGYKLAVVGRAKVFHDVELTKYSTRPNLFYYALRSKIFFHRDLDPKSRYLIFHLCLPIYLIYYLNLSIRSQNPVASMGALFRGLIDGIRNKEGIVRF